MTDRRDIPDEPPEWVDLGFRDEPTWRAWRAWKDAVARGEADPRAWISVEGEGAYPADEFIHVSQLAAFARANVIMQGKPESAATAGAEADGEFLGASRLAALLSVDRKTIERRLGEMTEGEHYIRIGRRVLYRRDAVIAFFSSKPALSITEDALLDAFQAKSRRK